MGFPSTPILDDFNRSNEDPMTGWSYPFPTLQEFEIISNECRPNASGDSVGTYDAISALGTTFELFITLVTVETASGDGAGILFNGTFGAPFNWYTASTDGSGTIELSRTAGAVPTSLATASVTVANGCGIGVRKRGSSIEVWFKPAGGEWALEITHTDATYSGGECGIATSDGTTWALDDWGGNADTEFGGLDETLGSLTSSAAGELAIDGDLDETLGALTLDSDSELAIDGSLSETLGELTLDSDAVLSDPNTGELDETLAELTLNSAADLPIDGDLDETLGELTLSSAGNLTTKGVLDETLADLTLSSEADLAIDGDLSETLAELTLSSAAELDLAGVLDETLEDLSLSSAAELDITGQLDETLGELTLSSTGSTAVTGQLDETLADLTLSAAGELDIEGSLSETLDDLTLDSDSQLAIDGGLNENLDDLTLSSTGNSGSFGELDETLEDLALSSAGELPIDGDLDETLDDLTLSSASQLSIDGDLDETLGELTLSSTGNSGSFGELDETLDDLTLSSTAELDISGILDETLGTLTLSSAGALAIDGDLDETLDELTLSSTGVLASGNTGVLDETLEDLALSSAGELAIDGQLAETLEDLTLSSAGSLDISGILDETLEDLTLSSVGLQGIDGELDETLDDLTLSSTGGEITGNTGDLDVTLDGLTFMAQGGDISDLTYDRVRERHVYTLEKFRKTIAYHPYHFYQQASASIPVNSECNTLVYTHGWQNSMMAGREDIRAAVALAQQKIRDYLGYRVFPEFVTREIRFPRPNDPRMHYGQDMSTKGNYLSVNIGEGYVKSIGAETFEEINTAAGVTYSDENNDSLNDTATVSVIGVSSDVGVDDVVCYVPDGDRPDGTQGPHEKWQVFPRSVAFDGGTLTIIFDSWVMLRPILLDGIQQTSKDPQTIANFMQSVQVYRRYTKADGTTTDDSQAVLIWEADPPSFCDCSSSNPVIRTDPAAVGVAVARCGISYARTGDVLPGMAVYNATSDTWSGVNWSTCRQPDRVKIRYQAGADLSELTESNISSTDWTGIITRLAVAELSQHICACEGSNRYIDYWSEDLSQVDGNAGVLFRQTDRNLQNPFGTRRGHIDAWNRVKHLALTHAIAI